MLLGSLGYRAGTIPVSQYSLVSWQGNKTPSGFTLFRETTLMLKTNVIMLSSRVTCIYFPGYSTHLTYSRFLKGPKCCFGFSFLPWKTYWDTNIITALLHYQLNIYCEYPNVNTTLTCSNKVPSVWWKILDIPSPMPSLPLWQKVITKQRHRLQ